MIFFRTELSHILDGLIYVHNYIVRMLHMIFSDDAAGKGRLIQNMITLLIISLLSSFIIASVFWLIKRVAMPHIMDVIWVFG